MSSDGSKDPRFDASVLFTKTANIEEFVGYYLELESISPLANWLNHIEKGLELNERDKEVIKILKELEEK